ncbi:Hypothetical predicted protein [Lecanosticta acicola]|uniref:Cupin type-2 domain-containing protein n=1 Tax=Lecanosticta acicola TaxID=111012 RepID=A0AAI9EE21_9PEZI|nr:Hypothetical predicted protein [Lecanosticta acicola]
MAPPNHLKPPTRLITTHNAEGKAIISDTVPEELKPQDVEGANATFYLSYCTDQYPVDMNQDRDLKAYERYAAEPPGLVIGSGTVLRHVDIGPGSVSPMHRTVSLDYGIVIEGDIELILDSGETRRMAPGDICVQRGTMHAWRNASDTKWARMLYVLQPSKPLQVGSGGKVLGEDYGGTMRVRAST